MAHTDEELLHVLHTAHRLTVTRAALSECCHDLAQADLYDTVSILLEAARGLLNGAVTGAVAERMQRLQREQIAADVRAASEACVWRVKTA